MELIKGFENLEHVTACAVTIGSFDGVHRGHLKIIEALKTVAAVQQLCSTVVTFEPHPRLVVRPDLAHSLKFLTTLDEKEELFRQAEINRLIIIPFSREFAGIEYDSFVRDVLIEKIKARAVVVGYDHTFGHDRQGNFEKLSRLSESYNFTLKKVEVFEVEGLKVNSTNIRRLLLEGKIETANTLLGRRYTLTGRVVKGRGEGFKLGFPTANLRITDSHKLIPADGVYAVDVLHKMQIYKGMLNIGYRPTISASAEHSIEVHIIGLSEKLIDQHLTINFKKRLRNEIKFDNRAALISQLEIDKQESLKV